MIKKIKIDYERIPKHVGIILDGNGRWATMRGLPRETGHKEGMNAVKRTVYAAKDLGIKVLSLFAFSTENWKRSQHEIDCIFDLVRDYLKENNNEYLDNNIKLRTMGDISKLPKDLCKSLNEIVKKTENCNGLIVNLALNYGSRTEIIRAIKQIQLEEVEDINEQKFLDYLYTKDLPEPDLIIRTSGEQRLSNFMLYQSAYAEFYFPKIHWPDFNKNQLIKAIMDYQKRDRRFGGIKEKNK